jgi:hypothetical protein
MQLGLPAVPKVIGPYRTPDFIEPPILEDLGMELVTRALVRYRPSGGADTIAEAGHSSSSFGLHEFVDTAGTTVDTKAEAEEQAAATVQQRRYPRTLSTGPMAKVCDIHLADLVPGHTVSLDLGGALCVDVVGKMRLAGVAVTLLPEMSVSMHLENLPTVSV